MILAVDGVRVAGRDTPTPHDVTWFRPHGTPCVVQVLRAGLPMDISVEHKILDYTADVSVLPAVTEIESKEKDGIDLLIDI